MRRRTEALPDGIRYALGEYSRVVTIFLVFLAVAAAFVAYGTWKVGHDGQPASLETGEVIRFGAIWGKAARITLVVVRTRDGRLVTLQTSADLLTHCRAGGTIRLSRQGGLLEVRRPGCAPPM